MKKSEILIIFCLLIAFLIAFGIGAFAQDSIEVKILKVKPGKVWMKTIERPRVKLKTECSCPYKEKQIITIKKPVL